MASGMMFLYQPKPNPLNADPFIFLFAGFEKNTKTLVCEDYIYDYLSSSMKSHRMTRDHNM
jgi:hypothetical protein